MLWCKWPWPQVSLRRSLSRKQADGSEATCYPQLGGTDRQCLSMLQPPPLWPFKVQRRGGAPQERQREGGDKGLPKGHSHSLTLCSVQLSGPQSILLGKWREGALGKMVFKARQLPSLEEEARLEQDLLFHVHAGKSLFAKRDIKDEAFALPWSKSSGHTPGMQGWTMIQATNPGHL